MNKETRIATFTALGEVLRQIGENAGFKAIADYGLDDRSFKEYLQKALSANPWFTPESVFEMFSSIGTSLTEDKLGKWAGMYEFDPSATRKTVAVIMAGNIPAVGFHDFLSVLMAGHDLQAKLSSDDQFLIPAIAALVTGLEPQFEDRIEFRDDTISDFDAVIATGSNNTSRYFDYYFGKYPHIIRKNRNALAVINGRESHEELRKLGKDIFSYYGLGCRNVSKLMVPEEYDFKAFFKAIETFSWVGDHNKYRNNYDYNKSIFLVNGDDHLDNGFLLLKDDPAMSSPVSVMHYERYTTVEEINEFIDNEKDSIQCVISSDGSIMGAIPPGTAQHPKLWDYADGIDTMEFLLNL